MWAVSSERRGTDWLLTAGHARVCCACSRCSQPCYLLEFERPPPDDFLSQLRSGLVAVLVKRVPFQPSALLAGSRHRTIAPSHISRWNWEPSLWSSVLRVPWPLMTPRAFSRRHQSHFSLPRAVDRLRSVLFSVVVFASGFFRNCSLMLSCHGNVFLLFLIYNYNIVQRFNEFR